MPKSETSLYHWNETTLTLDLVQTLPGVPHLEKTFTKANATSSEGYLPSVQTVASDGELKLLVRSSSGSGSMVEEDLLPDTVAPELSVTAAATIFPPDGKWRAVDVEIQASDDSGKVEVELVEVIASGQRAEWREGANGVEVRAVAGASYTLEYRATDPTGNSTTAGVIVEVRRR